MFGVDRLRLVSAFNGRLYQIEVAILIPTIRFHDKKKVFSFSFPVHVARYQYAVGLTQSLEILFVSQNFAAAVDVINVSACWDKLGNSSSGMRWPSNPIQCIGPTLAKRSARCFYKYQQSTSTQQARGFQALLPQNCLRGINNKNPVN